MKQCLTYIFFFCWFVISPSRLHAQTIPDSLINNYKKAKSPKQQMVALADLAYGYMYTNPDTALVLNERAIKIAEKLKLLPEVAQYEYEKAIYFHVKSDFKSAMAQYDISIRHFKKMARSKNKNIAIKGRKGIAKAINNKGNIYFESGKYADALQCFFEGLAKNELVKDKTGEADNLKGIANVYLAQDNYTQAINYLQKSLKKARESGYTQLEGSVLGTLGTAFNLMGKYDTALTYLLKSYDMAVAMGDVYSQSIVLGNMAASYSGMKHYDKSEECYSKAMPLYKMMGQFSNIAITYLNLGNAEKRKKNGKKAENYYLRSLAISDSVNVEDVKLSSLKYLYTYYDSTKQYVPALTYYSKYIALRNELNSDENTRRQTEIELNYAYGRKKAADSLQEATKKQRLDIERKEHLRNQNLLMFAGIGGIVVMLVISIISLRAFREKKRTNGIIALQKMQVEEKQKELLDSIHYAKRIQKALLPSEKNIQQKIKRLSKP